MNNIEIYFKKLYNLKYIQKELIDKIVDDYNCFLQNVSKELNKFSIFPIPTEKNQSITIYWDYENLSFRITAKEEDGVVKSKWTFFNKITKKAESGYWPEEKAFSLARKLSYFISEENIKIIE